MRSLAVLAIVLSPFVLSGCFPAAATVATGTGVSLAENRSLGRKLDDNVIAADITNRYAQTDFKTLVTNVTIHIRFGRVMLTGNVPRQDVAEQAVALAWQARGVTEVINELKVTTDDSIWATANDIAIKKNLQGRLLITKDVWMINYSIDVSDGVAYILGRTQDRPEMNRVLNIARTTKGVKKVVNYLQSSDALADPTASPNAPQPTSGPPSSVIIPPTPNYETPKAIEHDSLAPNYRQ